MEVNVIFASNICLYGSIVANSAIWRSAGGAVVPESEGWDPIWVTRRARMVPDSLQLAFQSLAKIACADVLLYSVDWLPLRVRMSRKACRSMNRALNQVKPPSCC